MRYRYLPLGSPLAASLVGLLLGCSDVPSAGDAGPGGRRLVIVGDADVGLAPTEERSLRVRYLDAAERPLASGRIEFAIFGDPRGSTLSAATVFSDEHGEAVVLVRAGAVSCRFQVLVKAPSASAATFYVEVSAAGFGSLAATSTYLGTNAAPEQLVELRYQLLAGLVCSGLDPLSAPLALRERVASSLDQPVAFKALPLDRDHALLALASDNTPRLRAWGCLDVPRGLPQPDRELSLSIPLRDFLPRLAGTFEVASDVSLPGPGTEGSRPLAEALRPFVDLADCPRDPAQLLLDCMVDALDPADPADCRVSAPSAAALAIQAERGLPDRRGCRGATSAAGGTSIDEILRKAMSGTGKPVLTALEALPAAAASSLRSFQISSKLELLASGAGGAMLAARHRLESVTFRREGEQVTLPTSLVGLPAPLADPVEIHVEAWRATLLEHGFGLRFGSLARLALGKLCLAPAGLPESSPELASKLAELVSGPPQAGCPAIDALTCAAARLPAGCLSKACPEGLQALARYLDSGFEFSAKKNTDFSWTGQADLKDDDGDLRVDRIGTHETPGTWNVQLMLGPEVVTVQAMFQARRQ